MKIRLHRQADEGIALVITLIMLAVTLVMAVAFLAISTRERGSVATSTDANHARLATDAALAHAEGQIIANLLSTTNAYNFDLLVSTNFINRYGFNENASVAQNPTNVNYDYTSGGGALTLADLQQNIANLEYLPRAPVFVPTNNLGYNDFRYYLDLNRNRQFDDTGPLLSWLFINGTFTTNNFLVNQIGDPQWIGVLEHPDQPHGPLNRFIARYAFIAVPVGNTLDVNAIYNDSTMPDHLSALNMKPSFDGYLRNEGVGSWELNLAAFLTDLNTNEWGLNFTGNGYNYKTPLGLNNSGAPFDDALAILRYRYAFDIANQTNIFGLYYNFPQLMVNGSAVPNTEFRAIDNYSVGPLMTNLTAPYLYNSQNPRTIWAGADNTNHFFGLSDFFNPNIFRPAAYSAYIPVNQEVFTDRLLHAGTNIPAGANQVPTYDRYTFYRMLAQLGTESEPQVGKININYTNVDVVGDVQPFQTANLVPWGTNSLAFFNLAADAMLRTYTTNWYNLNLTSNGNFYAHYYFTNTFGTNTGPFGITNIPVWVGGKFAYTPAVNRLLQLAANIYDATTNYPYPSVFRPKFTKDINGDIYINGYTNVGPVDFNLAGSIGSPLYQPVDISAVVAGTAPQPLDDINIYGVPWIVGAKKGLPNFNELYVMNTVKVSRLVQVSRGSIGNYNSSNYRTNQMFVMSISNSVGMSMWNSYDADFVPLAENGSTPAITVYLHNHMVVGMTNGNNSGYINTNFNYSATFSTWPGSHWSIPNAAAPPPYTGSFFYTNWTMGFLPPSIYQYPSGLFVPVSYDPASSSPPAVWQTAITENYPFPQSGMMTTNWSQAYILVGPPGAQHVVDYVQFSGPNRTRDLAAEIADKNYPDGTGVSLMWSANTLPDNNANGDNPYGLVNQIQLSRGSLRLATAPPGGRWSAAPVAPGVDTSPAAQQAAFGGFFTPSWRYLGVTYYNTNLVAQVPYTPTRTMYDYTLWQANDPLVHYLASDLNFIGTNGTSLQHSDAVAPTFNVTGLALNQIGQRFQPWGLAGQMMGIDGVDTNAYNLAYKDPLVTGPDNWQFPTNLFPSIGWLGRVHRGTPWQTVYLKSPNILVHSNQFGAPDGLKTWKVWSGDDNNSFDAENSAPAYDRWLFDLFTASPNQNATMGQLSVNQTHLAAWSAVFSGIPVYTNLTLTNAIFEPAGTNGLNSYLGYIYKGIQDTRNNTNLFPNQVFSHLGDVLATPALTDQSPFLPWNDPTANRTQINDSMYEWLPQETLGLLKVGTPRYVIYCYGQALKPAQNGILAGGNYPLMCTNYTVVSESAVRAVVEIQGTPGSTPHVVLKNVNPLPPDQ